MSTFLRHKTFPFADTSSPCIKQMYVHLTHVQIHLSCKQLKDQSKAKLHLFLTNLHKTSCLYTTKQACEDSHSPAFQYMCPGRGRLTNVELSRGTCVRQAPYNSLRLVRPSYSAMAFSLLESWIGVEQSSKSCTGDQQYTSLHDNYSDMGETSARRDTCRLLLDLLRILRAALEGKIICRGF